MKKVGSKSSKVSSVRVRSRKHHSPAEPKDELRTHYDFDYSKASSNRFASRLPEETLTVVLDPDVATIFHSSESVNAFLRSAISAMPGKEQHKRKRAS